MIPLSQLNIVKKSCNTITVTDVTDYTVGRDVDRFNNFEKGQRIIRITYPDGSYKLYNKITEVNMLPGPGNPNPVDLEIIELDTSITTENNGNASWDFTLEPDGQYYIDILILPKRDGAAVEYEDNSVVFEVNSSRAIPGYSVLTGTPHFVICNLNKDFTLTEIGTEDTIPVNTAYIMHAEVLVDCSSNTDEILCIFSKYKSAFCGSCKCENICKNPASNNILKATMLLRELELLDVESQEYQDKLALYTPIFNTLCRCS